MKSRLTSGSEITETRNAVDNNKWAWFRERCFCFVWIPSSFLSCPYPQNCEWQNAIPFSFEIVWKNWILFWVQWVCMWRICVTKPLAWPQKANFSEKVSFGYLLKCGVYFYNFIEKKIVFASANLSTMMEKTSVNGKPNKNEFIRTDSELYCCVVYNIHILCIFRIARKMEWKTWKSHKA